MTRYKIKVIDRATAATIYESGLYDNLTAAAKGQQRLMDTYDNSLCVVHMETPERSWEPLLGPID